VKCKVSILVVLLLLAGRSQVAAAQKQEVAVAAAADLKFAMAELSAQFEARTGAKINVTYGSSGNFFTQLQNGAPFDLFFSADIDYPRKLDAAGLAEPATLYQYAVGRIVIWVPAASRLDVAKLGWQILLEPQVQKVSIANPEHAPYGRAAVAAMQKAGIYEQVKPKLVFGENISQAAQFVQSGNAQAGILALSLAISPGMKDGKSWEIPAELYPPIAQGAIVMKDAKNKETAASFLDFVKSKASRDILQKYGFVTPAGK
jgi:molybdate transport system substrate-binding protein